MVAWATFKQDSFKFVKGSEGIKTYRSSPTGVRKFCGACGTQLVCIISATDVGVTAASLDEPAFVNPTCHFYCRSQLPWLKIEDELPKYIDNGRRPHTRQRRQSGALETSPEMCMYEKCSSCAPQQCCHGAPRSYLRVRHVAAFEAATKQLQRHQTATATRRTAGGPTSGG